MATPGNPRVEMIQTYESRQAASEAAGAHIVAALERQLASAGEAALVVSGGTTPGATFEYLSRQTLAWESVSVLPSDERWVAPEHDDSNEKLVRETLLIGAAAPATFVPLFAADVSAEQHVPELDRRLGALPSPFACSLLGMGADGHFASLFPDADSLAEGLDPDAQTRCLAVRTAASPHPRMSLTLSALLDSDSIALLVFGDEKMAVIERAQSDPDAYPVSRLLQQDRTPVAVFWAP